MKKLWSRLSTMALLLIASVQIASAEVISGPMPWDTPLEKIMQSISGPVAQIIGVIVIVLAGLGIAFGESGSGVRRIFQIVFGLAIAFSASSILIALFHPAGM